MCGFAPTIRSRISPCNPVIRASAMTSAMTPTVTPSVEMNEITEMNACFRLASRYRSATWSSKGTSITPVLSAASRQAATSLATKSRRSRRRKTCPVFFVGSSWLRAFVVAFVFLRGLATSVSFPHQRKQDHVANRRAVGEEHDQAIDPYALAGRGRQAVLEGMDVIVVHFVRLEVAAPAIPPLRLEAAPLLDRIVQLAERVRDFEAADVELEPLDRVGIARLLLRERRHLGWKLVHEGRLDQVFLAQGFENVHGHGPGAVARIDLDGELARQRGGAIACAKVGVRHVAVESP